MSTGDGVSSVLTIEQSIMICAHGRGRDFGGREFFGGGHGSW